MVAGLVTRRQNGHIAIAGPLVNLGLFIIGIPLGVLLFMLTGAAEFAGQQHIDGSSIIWQAMVYDIVRWWLYANIGLGLFNMIPFGPLDGLKVKDWSEGAFFCVIGVFALLVLTMFTGVWSPSSLLTTVAEPVSNLVR